MAIDQAEKTKRVREIFAELKKRKTVRFNRDFLGFLGLNDSEMSAILKEDSTRPVNLPTKYHGRFKQHWKITDEYWTTGKGKMFNEDPDPEPDIMVELNENIKILIEEIKKLNAR